MSSIKSFDNSNIRVVVISGGRSDEREISLDSGAAVASALRDAGFRRVSRLDPIDMGFHRQLEQGGYDVAFLAMHGRQGEDGCLQGMLEMLGIPYTFSGVLASAVAADKSMAKRVYRDAGIPTPEGISLDIRDEGSLAKARRFAGNVGLPVFVKPASNGSSFGVSKVVVLDELDAACSLAASDDKTILVEQCVEGMEVTVPVLGNNRPIALPIVEIVTGSDFYDLKVKYEPSVMHHMIPARLEKKVLRRLADLAIMAHTSLGCRGCSRSDFIVTEEGNPFILETNTIPGMTSTSLLPDSAASAGIPFPELCTMFVELALEQAG